MKIKWLIILMVLCAAGCRSVPQGGDNPVSPDIYRRWHESNSYYALIEIIDAHLTSRPNHNRATSQDVLRHLGKPNWGAIHQDSKNQWAYQGNDRHLPYGDKVIFTFNNRDELIDIEWVSE